MLQEYFEVYRDSLISSVIILLGLLLIRYLVTKGVKRVGQSGELNSSRTLLIIKYVNSAFWILLLGIYGFIWSINLQDIGLLLSSVFAVIGVALFAQWSIISNITAGVILFFSFPYKIGDRIRIQDKDFPEEAIIEDIRAFHLLLRTESNELLTYPNNLILQKGVVLVQKLDDDDSGV
ncbi:mechanosensitive ion channel [Robertkochia marina]|uniref:Mechanosensitive ion channel n=1 Tax=Robertkochia marina TaxID=1227945 RepID=A0A4V3UY31_9FLAO|nr:mechanosensitive ion channel domain-containing protein [Robertkochia marina]THD67526.1 mechanosensitive ion channel [Robertkochia marina]TRZ44607.1 mechanosensitive ion channel family protein [Robertkochia marina]